MVAFTFIAYLIVCTERIHMNIFMFSVRRRYINGEYVFSVGVFCFLTQERQHHSLTLDNIIGFIVPHFRREIKTDCS